MAVERVEEERLRLLEHRLDVADHEERSDLAALAAFARELDRELDDVLEGLAHRRGAARARGDRAEDPLEIGHTGSNDTSRFGIPTKRKPSAAIAPIDTSDSSSSALATPSR